MLAAPTANENGKKETHRHTEMEREKREEKWGKTHKRKEKPFGFMHFIDDIIFIHIVYSLFANGKIKYSTSYLYAFETFLLKRQVQEKKGIVHREEKQLLWVRVHGIQKRIYLSLFYFAVCFLCSLSNSPFLCLSISLFQFTLILISRFFVCFFFRQCLH